MDNYTHAQLLLRGVDVATDSNTATSYSDGLRTVLTWKNINLRTILGTMYDKFDTFNMSLNLVSSDHPSASLVNGNAGSFGGGDIANIHCMFMISGLPFANATYNQPGAHNSNVACIGCFTYPPLLALATNSNLETSVMYKMYNGNTIITFNKNQEQCDITISLLRVSDFTRPISATVFPNTNFLFDIIGVDNTQAKRIF